MRSLSLIIVERTFPIEVPTITKATSLGKPVFSLRTKHIESIRRPD